jgi:Ni,Fe-hydrogenase III component G
MKAAGGTIFFKDLSPSDLNALAESFVNRVSSMEEVSKRNLSIEVDRKLLEDIAKSGEGSA